MTEKSPGQEPIVNNAPEPTQAPVNNQPASPEANKPDAAKPQEPKNFLEDEGEGKQAPADWPSDWREKMAGEDEKFLNKLKRFSSPMDYTKSYRELEKTLSGYKKPLPDNATAEELSQWRKENGIPETADKYEIKLDDGLVVGEEDKDGVNYFLQDMHKLNTPPETVNKILTSYFKLRDKNVADFHTAETQHRQETIETLRSEWGPEYQVNRNMIMSFLAKQPDGIGDLISNARDGDGRALMNTPGFAKWVANMAREIDPVSTVAHFTGKTGVSVEDRIKEIQQVIRDEPGKYYADKKMQEEMVKLTEIQNKSKSAA